MVTQTLISFKVDSDLISQVEHVKSCYGINRNKLINHALRFVLETISLQESCVRGSELPNYISSIE